MIVEYIDAALAKATYEKIEDKEHPYYGRVPVLKGVWATGKTPEQCRNHLGEVIEGWLIVRLRKGLAMPPIGLYAFKAAPNKPGLGPSAFRLRPMGGAVRPLHPRH